MSGVLVTSVATALDVALVRALLADPERTVVVAGSTPYPGELSPRLVHVPADLARSRDIRGLLFGVVRRLAIDTVVHAARTPGDVESTRVLLHLAERHPTLRRFVFQSHGDVYRIDPHRSSVITEEQPIDLSPGSPQRVRNRVEADLTVCTRMGLSPLGIVVLRCAEILAPGMGSQLFDYLASPLCLRPLGFNPMVNLLTIEDAVRAIVLSVDAPVEGLLNIPGADTLPLSEVVAKSGRVGLATPGFLLAPLYRLRASTQGWEFRYDANYRRFHFSAVLDGRRAKSVLGYEPLHRVQWPGKQASEGEGMPVRRGTPRSVPAAAPDDALAASERPEFLQTWKRKADGADHGHRR